MGTSQRSPDCIVVGGGVIGLAVAYELLRRGKSVRVLERDRLGSGATFAAAGMLAPVSEVESEGPGLLEFGRESLSRFPGFIRSLEAIAGGSCRYRTDGTMWVAVRRDHLAELKHLHARLRDLGLPSRELSAGEACKLEPHLTGRVLGGIEVSSDHQVDPRALVECLGRAIRELGGSIATGMRVESVTPGMPAWSVSGSDESGSVFTETAERVVLAAGAWSSPGIRAPIGQAGPRPVKGQLVRLRGPVLLTRVIRTPDVYVVPRADGELLVGGTMEEMGFDTTPTGGAVMDLLRRAWEVVPGTYDHELIDVRVGLRSAVDDHLPVIGESVQPGLFLAFGHFRNGVLLAPATAHYLAEWIVSGHQPPRLAAFVPARMGGHGDFVEQDERLVRE